MGISGAVWNDGAGVVVEAEGSDRQLDDFAAAFQSEAPAQAAVRSITADEIGCAEASAEFVIRPSPADGQASAEVAVDLAVCPECLAEIRDAGNVRRHGYALPNCTQCGPRISIIRAIPYDRPNTTMAGFAMCADCQREYDDPLDRRFHAQPTACCKCGPQMRIIDSDGRDIEQDPIVAAAQLLAAGKILAIKGLGGFHLAARADDQGAVHRLRQLKHRPAKPFALMCASAAAAGELAHFSPRGWGLLKTPAAPIVLAGRIPGTGVAADVAPGQHRLGVMLAYTPLQHLIFDGLWGWGIRTLVMTSGNDADEPLVFADDQAAAVLGPMCDALILHDRPIQRALDDSVVVDAGSGPIFLRRARGYVPTPTVLPAAAGVPHGLAMGAELKSTIAVFRDGQAVLSQHLGTLTHTRTLAAFRQALDDLRQLFDLTPQWIAHDMHPAYVSTQHAKLLAQKWNVPRVEVQHHHAHAAAALAENGLTGPALAIICDGTGYGTDQTIWGGEILSADLVDFRRLGHLRRLRLPGGDAAARQPWRSAMALLYMAYGDDFAELPICQNLAAKAERDFIAQMLVADAGCIPSSSTGRLFDAFAALLGLCCENHYDAQAPALLESSASAAASATPLVVSRQDWIIDESAAPIQIDICGLVRRTVELRDRGAPVPELALLFHQTLAAAFAAAAASTATATGLTDIVLSGGVFANELFADLLADELSSLNLNMIRHRHLPPNDGAIALGQAAVAAARWKRNLIGESR